MAAAAAFAPAAEAEVEAVLAPLVEPPELFCLRAAVRVLSSVAHGLAEPGITVRTCGGKRRYVRETQLLVPVLAKLLFVKMSARNLDQ